MLRILDMLGNETCRTVEEARRAGILHHIVALVGPTSRQLTTYLCETTDSRRASWMRLVGFQQADDEPLVL